ncbi:MAG: dehydrogenase, short-chain alcohol dehydrogenase like [Actinomycetia bacterium]|nr:dehydrogenase, short-chain alcohol dehydrogenase like [Actinomycetes bacterium]
MFSVAGKRVLVTGGSSGIGAMLAAGFRVAGAEVTSVSRTEGDDVSTEAGCQAIAAGIEGPLDVLVNNAGATAMVPLEDMDDATWDDVLSVNLKAVSHLTRFLLPNLRAAAAPARVINIGSLSGERVGNLDNYAYTSSKAALHHLTRHLARRLAPEITVNAIAPGPFESKMMAPVLEAHGDAIARSVPLGRIGAPEDIAGAAIYLASPAAAWVTGTILTLDGGLSLT